MIHSGPENVEDGEVQKVDEPKPGTSIQSHQQAPIIQEEQLINNPVFKQMMQTFFNEQFKNIQMSNGNEGKGNSNQGMSTNKAEKLIKSPSATTLYAPPMQKKIDS